MTRRAATRTRARRDAAAHPPIGRPRKFREAMGLVSLRLPLDMLAAIERIAGAQHVGVADVIRDLLRDALERAHA